MRPRTWLAVAAILLAIPAAAAAHATVLATAPAQGGGIRIQFSDPVEAAFLRVTRASGGVVAARVDPADPQAVLVESEVGAGLILRVLSRDGHVTRTELPAVGGGSRRDPAQSIAADVLTFAGLVALLGLVVVRFLIVAPAWRSGGPRPPGTAAGAEAWRVATAEALRGEARGWWIAVWASAGAAAAGLALAATSLLADLGAGAGDLGTLVGDTRWGRAWLVQALALVAAASAAAMLRRRPFADDPDPPRGWGIAVAVPTAIALVAISTASHASSGTDASIGIGIDALHILATACWIGGLLALVLTVPVACRGLTDDDGVRLAAGIVVRFSGLAIACVGVLVVTGVYRAIAELSAVGDLVDTGYGRALLVKLAVFALLLVGGAYNRLVLHPRLERAALGLREPDVGVIRRLRVSVIAELGLAAALLVIVGVLVSLPPP